MRVFLLAAGFVALVALAASFLGGCATTSGARAAYVSMGTTTERTVSATVRSDGSWETNVTTRSVYHSPAMEGLRALAGAAKGAL